MGAKHSTEQLCGDSSTLKDEYRFQSNHVLIHKKQNKICTLHQIAAHNQQQSNNILQNIEKYKTSQCQSIMRIKQSFFSQKDGYCTNLQYFYLVFQGHHGPNIKEEYLERRYLGQGFEDDQIQAVLSCMLCGLREYHKQFQRKRSYIQLNSILINRDQYNRMTIKDPWLIERQDENSPTPINFLATYPSPQKIHIQNNQPINEYSEFQSDLFSAGILGLQLKTMNYRDDIYAYKKYVDRMRINQYLNSIGNPRLRSGLAILLNENSNERTKIYDFWRISCLKRYCLRYSHVSIQPDLVNQNNDIYINHQDIYPQNMAFKNMNQQVNIHSQYQPPNFNTHKTTQNSTGIQSPFRQTESFPLNHNPQIPSFSFGDRSLYSQNSLGAQKFVKLYNNQARILKTPFSYENFRNLNGYWQYYEGQSINNMKNGFGKLYLTNGQHFQGVFKANQVNGQGKFFRKDGKIISGLWRQSQLVTLFTT